MRFSPEVERLFHSLADLDREQRGQYFREHPTDPDTRREVEALLACDEYSLEGLNELVSQQVDLALAEAKTSAFGPYRLLKVLGRGGMSEVWLAERIDGLLKRPVALKLPYVGVRGGHFAERLQRERDILAGLEHRGIARLYDAGVAEGNRPYLAIELIDGVNLSAHCRQRRLPLRQRLALFVQVLEAVQYAHSRLVIHRDLKPNNILVTPDGEVKLLDFGIAKLMVEGAASETELTRAEGRALTPSYASPEQISGQPVTTASDVYSLGIILFELISGGRPFVAQDGDAQRPSQTIASEEQASERATTRRKLITALKGDLDVITLKAIRKRPEDRYATADAFRADIQRYQHGEAVLAQPENVRYRLAKFIVRNKLAAGAAAMVFLSLAGGLGVALWQAAIARKEARTSATVQQFTEGIFRMNSRLNPDPVKAQQTTARQLLDMSTKEISGGLQDAPEAKVRMLEMLGSLYQDLGLEDTGVVLQRQRVAELRKLRGSESLELADALVDLGSCMHASRSVGEAQGVLLEAKAILDRRGDRTSQTRGRMLTFLSENYASSDLGKAVPLAKESIAVLRKWPASQEYATALYTAGVTYLYANELADASAVLNEAIALSKRLNGDPNPDLPRYFAFAAQAQMGLMRYGEAEQSYRAAYEYAGRLGGDEAVDTLETGSRLGTFFVLTSRSKEALPYLQKALTDCVHSKGADDPFYTPQMQLQYGVALDVNGRPEEALELISKAVKNRRQNRPGTRYLAQMLASRARVLTRLGRYEQADECLKEAEAILRKVNGKFSDDYRSARMYLALARGRLEEASGLLNARYAESGAPLSVGLLTDLNVRAEIALRKGEAAAVISLSKRTLEMIRAAGQERYLNVWRVRALVTEGAGYLRQHDARNAAAVLREAADEQSKMLDSRSKELAATKALLAQAGEP